MNSELSMDQVLIENLTNILEVNLDKEHFGVKELAKEVGLSRSQLHRKLISLVHKSTSRFIREYRLEKAMKMLQDNVATASEIAYRVGFGSPTYFNTCFRDYFGYPPGEVKFRNPIGEEKIVESKNAELMEASLITNEIKPSKKGRIRKRMVFINTFVIVLLSIVIYNLYQKYQNSIPSDSTITSDNEKSIAMLHFKNLSDDVENQYFVHGMMDDILNHLSGIQGLVVKSTQSSEKYKESNKTAIQIGEELGVNYLIDGTVQKYGDSLKVVIHFINARENHQINSLVYIEQCKNLFALQSKIAKQVAEELNITLSRSELEQLSKRPTENLEAYNMYLKGRFFWHRRTEEGINNSINYYNQAIELDSTYAPAFSGLADAYFVMPFWINVKDRDSVFSLAIKCAEKAISIDKKNAHAHATLGALLCYRDWNWEDSETELKLAIQLNPNYATAHQYYAELLEILGRAKEAREEIDLALSLNPNSWIMTAISSRLYMNEGLYEKAITEAKKAQELNKFIRVEYIMSCYMYLGKDDEAWAEWEEWQKIIPNPNIELNKDLRDAFKKSEMKGFWKYYTQDMLNTGLVDTKKLPVLVAHNLAYLGETEKALELLELTYEQRHRNIYRIKNVYDFINLRSEPRFLAILEKMNLAGY